MQEAIPIIGMIDKMRQKKLLPSHNKNNKVKCKAVKDNLGAIEVAHLPKLRPRIKHINIAYHHFRSFITNGDVSVIHISTHNQVADLVTNPLPQNIFQTIGI